MTQAGSTTDVTTGETASPSGPGRRDRYDVVVVGAGHNGLTAAAYLARAGLDVLVLERADHVGGAAVSHRAFAGVDVRLSRYSYLVSLLPDQVVRDLGLRLDLASRSVASYSPVRRDGRDLGLLVERPEGEATAASFRQVTGGSSELTAWQRFYADVQRLADVVAPTFLEPLRPTAELAAAVGDVWAPVVDEPLGRVVEERFADDLVRGVVLTDALIGTFTSAHDPSLLQNRCFLYHLVGNGTGEWRVPVGGMGAVTAELERAARAAGADVRTGVEVVSVSSDGEAAEVVGSTAAGGELRVGARWVLANVAPVILDRLLGRPVRERPRGSQLKINMVLDRLPRLRSGDDPRTAFAGTFHVDEGYAALEAAYAEAAAGALPTRLPAEVYCHTLTDPSIAAPDLVARGVHTLTLFGLHTPIELFDGDDATHERVRAEAGRRAVAGLDEVLAEPLEDCLRRDADGAPCIEVVSPRDLEAGVGLPGGHIFHGDLAWPWAETAEDVGRWGVETDVANVLVCGAGSRRGGGVSGIGGHNAAMAVLGR